MPVLISVLDIDNYRSYDGEVLNLAAQASDTDCLSAHAKIEDQLLTAERPDKGGP